MAKAAYWAIPDAQMRKLGERTGLETPVFLAVNDVNQAWEVIDSFCAVANALS